MRNYIIDFIKSYPGYNLKCTVETKSKHYNEAQSEIYLLFGKNIKIKYFQSLKIST